MIPKIVTMILFLVMIPALYADESGQQFEGFNLQGYGEGGEKSWDVTGETADIVGNIIKLTDIVANTYGSDAMNLKAESGSIDRGNDHMHLEKDVVITSKTGAKMMTDSLDWHKKEDLVTTNDKVVLTDQGMMATGTGATAHPGLKKAKLNEDVTVKVKSEPTKPGGQDVTITCDGAMEIDQAKSQAIFHDNVVAIQTDRELRADQMEVYFDPKTNQIEEMICLGNVSIKQGENTTHSEKAVYRAQDQKLTLSGKPKLILFTEGENSFSSMMGK